MKKKTIQVLLRNVHDKFVASIEDEEVRSLVEKNCYITGGAIPSMLLDEEVNDYDYYFKDKKTAVAVAKYYVEQYKKLHADDRLAQSAQVIVEEDRVEVFVPSAGVVGTPEGHELDDKELFEATNKSEDEEMVGDHFPVFLSRNAISLSGKIQLVLRFYGDIEEVHENYDYVHATCFWDSKTDIVTLPADALEAIITKELRYQGSKYPLASIIRSRKFIERGWSINAGQYLKMVLQLNNMDLTDLKILEEQLTGVDTWYFQEMLATLGEKEGRVETSYIIEVINKIF